jgi:hypothetical protein
MATVGPSRPFTTEARSSTSIRVYGLPISADAGGGTALASGEGADVEIVGIVYCGFKVGPNDVRLPTGRVFHLRRDQIQDSGEVTDYVVSGETVHFFDVPLVAEVFETRPRRVSLGAEMVAKSGGTFAALVATPPRRPPVDLADLESLSREQLLERVRELVAVPASNEFGGNEFGGEGPIDEFVLEAAGCAGYCQTNRTTWIGVIPKSDSWGGDCD